MEIYTQRAKNEDEWKIYIPTKLKAELIDRYHDVLKHPGTTRMINTINKNFGWPGLIAGIKKFVKNCDKCQRYKLTARKKYGKIPVDDRKRIEPWDEVHVDLVGPWPVHVKVKDTNKTEIKKSVHSQV